jgi:hypothetical protein
VAAAKSKERDEPSSKQPPVTIPAAEHPKTRSKLEQEAKLEHTKKEAKIKRCKVAVERLNEDISRRALLGAAASLEKRVENLQVTDTDRSQRRGGPVPVHAPVPVPEPEPVPVDVEQHVSTPSKENIGVTLCVTQQLEVLEQKRKILKSTSSQSAEKAEKSVERNAEKTNEKVEENIEVEKEVNREKIVGSSAEPALAAEKKENNCNSKLEKITDKPELTQSSPAVLGSENTSEADLGEEMVREKQTELVRKRRRKTNKTGFPATLKKKRRLEGREGARAVESSARVATPSAKELSIPAVAVEGKSDLRDEASVPAETAPPAEIRQTSSGRPLRECREKVEERPVEEQEATVVEPGLRGKKRQWDAGRGRGEGGDTP